MRRKHSVFNKYHPPTPSKRSQQSIPDSFQESKAYQFPTRHSEALFPDSLERFQQEIERSLLLQRQATFQNTSRKNGRRRAMTEAYDQQEEQEKQMKEIAQLQGQIQQLKGQMTNYRRSSRFQDKLDQLMDEMARNREIDRELMRQQQRQTQQTPPPNNIFYPPPMPYYPQPETSTRRGRRDTLDDTDYNYRSAPPRSKNRIKRILRKHFFAVLFTVFLRSQSKKLAQRRKIYLRTFYLQKFNSQMLNLKNWLVDGHSYCFPVILEKQKLDFSFWKEKRQDFAKEKQQLILKIVQIGLEKMKQECTPQKINLFNEILYNVCSRGAFAMSRFWSALEMKSICISQFFGCIRADQNLEKFLIGLMVFVKVLIFNMLLQPHKFDSVNFPKKKQPLTNNMFIIASVYYRLAKQVLNQYLDEPRPQLYKLGNWLSVPEEFIAQCCQPLIFDSEYPEPDEWITGMLGEELQVLQQSSEWGLHLARMRQIVDSLHREMLKRRKDVVRNQKYKLYN